MEAGAEKYLFNFETVLNRKEKFWGMAIDAPIVGEEVLKLYYDRNSADSNFLKGSFAARLFRGLKNHPRSKNELINFFAIYAEWLKLAAKGKAIHERSNNGPEFRTDYLQKEEKVIISYLNGNKKFEIQAFSPSSDGSYMTRTKVILRVKNKYKRWVKRVSVDSFLAGCK
jgi:hypothetical protein